MDARGCRGEASAKLQIIFESDGNTGDDEQESRDGRQVDRFSLFEENICRHSRQEVKHPEPPTRRVRGMGELSGL